MHREITALDLADLLVDPRWPETETFRATDDLVAARIQVPAEQHTRVRDALAARQGQLRELTGLTGVAAVGTARVEIHLMRTAADTARDIADAIIAIDTCLEDAVPPGEWPEALVGAAAWTHPSDLGIVDVFTRDPSAGANLVHWAVQAGDRAALARPFGAGPAGAAQPGVDLLSAVMVDTAGAADLYEEYESDLRMQLAWTVVGNPLLPRGCRREAALAVTQDATAQDATVPSGPGRPVRAPGTPARAHAPARPAGFDPPR